MLRLYLKRFLKNKIAIISSCFILFLIFIGIFAAFLVPYNPVEQDITNRLLSPSFKHILGTDDLGRDVFSRIFYGTRISLSVGIIAVGISILIGIILGLISGFFAGQLDSIIMRFVDVMLCFPTFFLLLMVIAFLEPNIYNVIIVIGLTSWPGITRLIRGEVLSVRQRDYIYAARITGVSTFKILFIHILPNVLAPIIVNATLGIGGAIMIESALSFLGLGVQPPTPSWGNILTSGKDYLHIAWWLSVFPGIAIFLTVLAFNLLGESLRDIFDPRI